MDRCGHCPCPASKECPAVARRVPRLCELADPANPDEHQREGTAAMLRGEPRPAPAAGRPSILARVASATAAAVGFVASGFEVLDAEGVAGRLAVCAGCDQRSPGGFCSGCSCWLEAKARLPGEDCPLGKWARA